MPQPKKRGGGLTVEKGRKATSHSSKQGDRSLPQAELKITSTNTRERKCGYCTACCTSLLVPELGKGAGTACQHVAKRGGCAIYGEHPPSCRGYRCHWLGGGLFEQRDRPDRLGLIVDDADGRFDHLARELGTRPVAVRQVRPGKLAKRAKAALEALRRRAPVFFCRPGDSGIGADITATSKEMLSKLAATLEQMIVMMRLSWEHEQGQHAEHVEDCPVCVRKCPAHPDGFLPICDCCRRVVTAVMQDKLAEQAEREKADEAEA